LRFQRWPKGNKDYLPKRWKKKGSPVNGGGGVTRKESFTMRGKKVQKEFLKAEKLSANHSLVAKLFREKLAFNF